MKMPRGTALLALYASLLLGCLDCYRVTPVRPASLPASGPYRRHDTSHGSQAYGGLSEAQEGQEVANSWDQRSEDNGNKIANSTHEEYSLTSSSEDETTVQQRKSYFGRFPGDAEEARTATYIIFKAFDSKKDKPEEELQDIVQNWISSLVHDSFFQIGIYRDNDGDLPLLLIANFNSFKAYDFVRSQLYARDPSASELLENFHFHISRHVPSPESYNVQYANFMSRRTAYKHMMRFLRRNRYRPPIIPPRPSYSGPERYSRPQPMQFAPPPPGPEHMYPPPVQGMHMPPPMMPQQAYMGQPLPNMHPPHVPRPM